MFGEDRSGHKKMVPIDRRMFPISFKPPLGKEPRQIVFRNIHDDVVRLHDVRQGLDSFPGCFALSLLRLGHHLSALPSHGKAGHT